MAIVMMPRIIKVIIISRNMSYKAQLNRNYWQDSHQIFFTPKLSLQGKNLFPQINDPHAISIIKQQPFLNILKKPIMSLYDRVQLRSEKKPVCIVGLPKQVENRVTRTGAVKRANRQEDSPEKKDSFTTCSHLFSKQDLQLSKRMIPSVSLGDPQGVHYYLLGAGNNKELMEKIMSRREGWLPSTNSIYHFRWEQARPKYQNTHAPHRQALNHLPGHEHISDKANLLISIKNYCEKNEEHMYRVVPVSFVFDFGSENIEEELKKFINFFVQCNQKSINPQIQQIKKRDSDSIGLESPKRSKKQTRNQSIRNFKNKNESIIFDSNKKKEQSKTQYKNLLALIKPFCLFQDMSSVKKDSPWTTPQPSQIYGDNSLWLLKPSDLNRGRGIKLFRTIDELGQLLKVELNKNQKGSFIVQKYIERPLLLKQRKFDIRVWAMVTHQRQIYFFREGYLRLSSQAYDIDSNSMFTHLTNNAVQKHASNYGEFEQGNILPISYLYNEKIINKQFLYAQIKRNIVFSLRAAGNKIYSPTQKNQTISIVATSPQKNSQSKTKYFQIFGYDFMVDFANHLWLIEVNTNPCIELSNTWLSMIIPRMLDDGMKLTVDKLFPRSKTLRPGAEVFPVPGYANDFNMWELLENERQESAASPVLSHH